MDTSYLTLKSLHVLGVVIFLGNIIVTGWWKVMADRTGKPEVIAFAQRQVALTDYVFTASGATLLLIAGWGAAILQGMDIFSTRWLTWGFWLLNLSGVLWVSVLIPVQIRQGRLAKQFANGGEIPQEYWKLGRIWIVVGAIATVLPAINIYWMVFKPL